MAAGARPIRFGGEDDQRSAPATSAASLRLTPLRELQLLEAHRAGGPKAQEALADLIRGYQRRIFTICLRMVRNRDEASDLAQDSIIKVLEGLPGYSGKSKLSTWVIRVTMNCCLSHLRKQKRRGHAMPDDSTSRGGPKHAGAEFSDSELPESAFSDRLGSGQPFFGSREPGPVQRVEQEQKRATIVNALDSLDADMRAILVLRDLQDLDYQQLAEVLEIPIGTVKSRLFRARACLRETLEARGGL